MVGWNLGESLSLIIEDRDDRWPRHLSLKEAGAGAGAEGGMGFGYALS